MHYSFITTSAITSGADTRVIIDNTTWIDQSNCTITGVHLLTPRAYLLTRKQIIHWTTVDKHKNESKRVLDHFRCRRQLRKLHFLVRLWSSISMEQEVEDDGRCWDEPELLGVFFWQDFLQTQQQGREGFRQLFRRQHYV